MGDVQTVRQAALTAGVARQTVARWLKKGILKPVKIEAVGHIKSTFVSVSQVKKIAKSRPQGRPKKGK